MFNISSFLEKFSQKISSTEDLTKNISEIVFTHTHITCPPESIKIQNNVLYLDISPAAKNKVFMNKKAILDGFSATIETKIIDIR